MYSQPQPHRNLSQWQQEMHSPSTLNSEGWAPQRGWRFADPHPPTLPHTQPQGSLLRGRGWASG